MRWASSNNEEPEIFFLEHGTMDTSNRNSNKLEVCVDEAESGDRHSRSDLKC